MCSTGGVPCFLPVVSTGNVGPRNITAALALCLPEPCKELIPIISLEAFSFIPPAHFYLFRATSVVNNVLLANLTHKFGH